jgi:hypothetical protein
VATDRHQQKQKSRIAEFKKLTKEKKEGLSDAELATYYAVRDKDKHGNTTIILKRSLVNKRHSAKVNGDPEAKAKQKATQNQNRARLKELQQSIRNLPKEEQDTLSKEELEKASMRRVIDDGSYRTPPPGYDVGKTKIMLRNSVNAGRTKAKKRNREEADQSNKKSTKKFKRTPSKTTSSIHPLLESEATEINANPELILKIINEDGEAGKSSNSKQDLQQLQPNDPMYEKQIGEEKSEDIDKEFETLFSPLSEEAIVEAADTSLSLFPDLANFSPGSIRIGCHSSAFFNHAKVAKISSPSKEERKKIDGP